MLRTTVKLKASNENQLLYNTIDSMLSSTSVDQ